MIKIKIEDIYNGDTIRFFKGSVDMRVIGVSPSYFFTKSESVAGTGKFYKSNHKKVYLVDRPSGMPEEDKPLFCDKLKARLQKRINELVLCNPPIYTIGVDTLDEVKAMTLVKHFNGSTEVILTKNSKSEKEIQNMVQNLAKYFDATVIEEVCKESNNQLDMFENTEN